MHIDFSALGVVFLAALLGAVAVVALFSAGVRELSAQAADRERGRSGRAHGAGAAACFAVCAAIVLYGLYLIAVR